ncbi:hypothetical protein V3C99_012675 [Haemonchus contortus]
MADQLFRILALFIPAVIATQVGPGADEARSMKSSPYSALHSHQEQNLCDFVRFDPIEPNLFIPGEIGPVIMFYNESEPQSVDLACLLREIVPHAYHTPIELPLKGGMVCMQLLTHPSTPGELHVLITSQREIMPFCETQVFGSLPTQIEARRTVLSGTHRSDFFTFSILANGGQMFFDVENKHDRITAKNLMLAFKMLISTYISGRPWQNGFPKFSRRTHMVFNIPLTHQKRHFLTTLYEDSLRTMFVIRYIPVLIYASLVALLLVIPFTRRHVQLDNILVDQDYLISSEEETTPHLELLQQKFSFSSETSSDDTQDTGIGSSEHRGLVEEECPVSLHTPTIRKNSQQAVIMPLLEEEVTQSSTNSSSDKGLSSIAISGRPRTH